MDLRTRRTGHPVTHAARAAKKVRPVFLNVPLRVHMKKLKITCPGHTHKRCPAPSLSYQLARDRALVAGLAKGLAVVQTEVVVDADEFHPTEAELTDRELTSLVDFSFNDCAAAGEEIGFSDRYLPPPTLVASAPRQNTMNNFIGIDVTKEFSGEEFYNGKVISCDEHWFQVRGMTLDPHGFPHLFPKFVRLLLMLLQVKYTDGEQEDYSIDDVLIGAQLFRDKNKRQR